VLILLYRYTWKAGELLGVEKDVKGWAD